MRDDDEDDDKPPQSLHICFQCHARSPPTSTGFTLISAQYGWRLSREKTPSGEVELRWFCPACWKSRKGDGPGPPSSSRR